MENDIIEVEQKEGLIELIEADKEFQDTRKDIIASKISVLTYKTVAKTGSAYILKYYGKAEENLTKLLDIWGKKKDVIHSLYGRHPELCSQLYVLHNESDIILKEMIINFMKEGSLNRILSDKLYTILDTEYEKTFPEAVKDEILNELPNIIKLLVAIEEKGIPITKTLLKQKEISKRNIGLFPDKV